MTRGKTYRLHIMEMEMLILATHLLTPYKK